MKHRPKEKKRTQVNADFYPEGGNLITGLTSTVAFKITDDIYRPSKYAYHRTLYALFCITKI